MVVDSGDLRDECDSIAELPSFNCLWRERSLVEGICVSLLLRGTVERESDVIRVSLVFLETKESAEIADVNVPLLSLRRR